MRPQSFRTRARGTGQAYLVIGFERRVEAERFLKEFRQRLAQFGLELHPEKTRLIEFGRFAAQTRKLRGEGKPETFTFLGFTHHCGKLRSTGAFTVWRKTAKKRMVAKLQAIKAELRRRMHLPPALVGEWLQKVTLGYYQYHAIPGNLASAEGLCRTSSPIVAACLNASQSAGLCAMGSA